MRIILFVTLYLFSVPILADQDIKVDRYKLKQAKNLSFRYGSGLSFRKASPYGKGSKTFYLIPSGEFEVTDGREDRDKHDIPHLAVAKLKKDSLQIKDRFPLYFNEDKKLIVDLEGIAAAPEEAVWLADEKNNYLLKVNLKTGAIIKTIKPGEGLPLFLNQAVINRGLESVTVSPDNKVYTALQSMLEGDLSFIRLIEYNPKSNSSKTFAILVNVGKYISPSEVKIGALQVIDENRLLLIEQGVAANNQALNKVYIIDIRGATDITVDGSDIKNPVKKELLLDLNQHGWNYRKAEGLTLVDPATIAVINDWDEGLSKNEMWLFTLPEPLFGWGPLEYAVFVVLILIFIFSTALTLIFVLKKDKTIND